ncbi:hypothetical protein SASPL_101349 [Salvia splendens]|uniref:glucomannan 4-beta-mannosyltransferase n=1 Tax=Salvia splendens TaxID=180675 RepID=A0A8X8YRJ6_SALSN|nr:hypothetical protein SASPL_101349 [Salvia splendens]
MSPLSSDLPVPHPHTPHSACDDPPLIQFTNRSPPPTYTYTHACVSTCLVHRTTSFRNGGTSSAPRKPPTTPCCLPPPLKSPDSNPSTSTAPLHPRWPGRTARAARGSCRGFTSSSCTKSRTRSRSSQAAASLSSARRIASNRTESKLYKVIKLFLALTVFLLAFELVAYFKGWHFSPPSLEFEIEYSVEYVYAKWLKIRAYYLAPLLQNLTNACIVLFMIQSVDRFVLVLGCFYIKIRGLRPVAETDYSEGDEKEGTDLESYPMVLVQIPMCNEREVRRCIPYQQSIGAVCAQDWPKARMLVQVLDDSDDTDVLNLIKAEVQKWQQRDVHIIYRHRLIRTGYKAGNLRSAMTSDYVKNYEFVAIFDADFQPGPDFLKKTIPYFKGKDDLALVQTRWGFVNKDENLLTRLQHINLAFHFEVEQQVNEWFINFFGFNGTAGVRRFKALEDCGGWLDRTTVEDMYIAVRAHLCGWKFIYLNDVQCLCELPESYEAYKKQQYRSYEWIVTKKLGRSSEAVLLSIDENEPTTLHKSSSDSSLAEMNKIEMRKKNGKKKINRVYRKELALALILLTASVRSLMSAQGIHFYFLLFQGITFLVVGLDLIGEQES